MTEADIAGLIAAGEVLNGLAVALPEINSQIQSINDGLRETTELVEPLLEILLTTLSAAEAVATRLRSE